MARKRSRRDKSKRLPKQKKKSRRKVAKKKSATSEPPIPPAKFNTRRKLLLAGVGLAAAALGFGVLNNNSHVPAKEVNPWDFATGDYRVQPVATGLYLQFYSPIGPEVVYSAENPIVLDMRNSLSEEYIMEQVAGKFAPGPVSLIAKLQSYAIPDSSGRSERMVDYARKAHAHLEERLNLPKIEMSWHVVKSGDDYSKDFSKRGFIFLQQHSVQRVYGTTDELDVSTHKFLFEREQRINGGKVQLDYQNDVLNWYFVMLTPGIGGLNQPFSELIPLSTVDQDMPYVESHGDVYQSQLVEAFSEGLSHYLSHDMVKQLNIPNGEQIVNDSLKSLLNFGRVKYVYVNNAVKWIEKNGMDAAVDLYMDEPKKFMDAIL